MRNEPVNRLGIKALSYWFWSGFLTSILWWLIPVAYYIFGIRIWSFPSWIIIILIIFSIIITYLKTALFPKIIWERWRYEISEHDIDLCYGLLIKKRTIIPMVKVQHVDTKQGPLMKRFALSSVTISTAAGEHEIPALAEEIADELRDRISILARVVEEDV
ncbi:MAG TPA: PH domain-containing protein [Syntrophomonadaceae bacterium]|nr:PH domain-containing protein [Syntrophomonadaceae bacterium]